MSSYNNTHRSANTDKLVNSTANDALEQTGYFYKGIQESITDQRQRKSMKDTTVMLEFDKSHISENNEDGHAFDNPRTTTMLTSKNLRTQSNAIYHAPQNE